MFLQTTWFKFFFFLKIHVFVAKNKAGDVLKFPQIFLKLSKGLKTQS